MSVIRLTTGLVLVILSAMLCHAAIIAAPAHLTFGVGLFGLMIGMALILTGHTDHVRAQDQVQAPCDCTACSMVLD